MRAETRCELRGGAVWVLLMLCRLVAWGGCLGFKIEERLRRASGGPSSESFLLVGLRFCGGWGGGWCGPVRFSRRRATRGLSGTRGEVNRRWLSLAEAG